MQQPEVHDPNLSYVPNGQPVVVPGEAVLPDTHGRVPIKSAPSTGKWLLLLVVLLAAALGIGFFVVSGRRASQEATLQKETETEASEPPPVDIVPVRYAAATHALQLPGECRAWYETTIYARVNGYVKTWFADIGDRVKEGQTLATIETPELDQQLAAAQAKVEADKAQINLAQATMHFSEVTLARFKDAPKGVVSDLERDQKAADYQTSDARVTAAQSDLNSAQAQVDQVRAMIAFQMVIAPFDGIITERRVDIGDLVTAGSTSSTTSLYRIVQADKIRVFVDVPESVTPEIHDGDKAIATIDEYPGRTFLGTVARNAKSLNRVTKTMRVEVDIPNKDMALLPGMYVQVSFQMNDAHPDLLVPASALTFRPEGPEVTVIAQDGRVSFKKVTIARDLGDVIEIANGISPDDRVALNISDQVADGTVVQARVVDDSTNTAQPPARAVTAAVPVTHPEN